MEGTAKDLVNVFRDVLNGEETLQTRSSIIFGTFAYVVSKKYSKYNGNKVFTFLS